MEEAYIVSAVRTPLGRFGGVLTDLSPVDLGAIAMRVALERARVSGEALDLYIFGNVLNADSTRISTTVTNANPSCMGY
ncbi:hypothetical protein [Nostoc sp. NMS8]|nr:hypothetical protein [Nostoc sp. NMS8]